ncbi:MAG: succinate dehydrogenase/fumarate reductase iron-sulfur subunit [Verrucomicrobiota bacterium]
MNIQLKVWRETPGKVEGHFETYEANDLSKDMSFLEMLDTVNEHLTEEGKEPIAFDHDCREGICGMCSSVINGVPHGPDRGVATCQVYMRNFEDGETITVEPFRAKPFPIVRDLVVDRTAFDRIQQAGGYVSVNTGAAPDANALPIAKKDADNAFDAAACIGCGACVAVCKNASAMLFTAAKVSHLSHLPQGQAEKNRRVIRMVQTMDNEGFGNCTNQYECEAACPKQISVQHIARMNRDYAMALLTEAAEV